METEILEALANITLYISELLVVCHKSLIEPMKDQLTAEWSNKITFFYCFVL